HHENEVAQSECATGKPFARYWMHNGFINIDNQKMSKSAGNFFTAHDIVRQYDPEAVRLFMLSAQYRSPVNFSREQIEQAAASLQRIYTARDNARFRLASAPEREMNADEVAFAGRAEAAIRKFDDAMDDDLNTADALGALFEHVRDMNQSLSDQAAPSAGAIREGLKALSDMAGVLGLLTREADEAPAEVRSLAEARQQAKKARDFAEADRLRAQVLALGYAIEDTPKGPKLKKV
ncbi:MAG: class I tRNA ligase family protein, partial [Clostridiales bacterium]|nr:class I tRNA ligase family protein [Clostridiales bacterium]